MPLPDILYCDEEGCLYLKVGDAEVKKNYGAILGVRRYGDKNTALKVSLIANRYHKFSQNTTRLRGYCGTHGVAEHSP